MKEPRNSLIRGHLSAQRLTQKNGGRAKSGQVFFKATLDSGRTSRSSAREEFARVASRIGEEEKYEGRFYQGSVVNREYCGP